MPRKTREYLLRYAEQTVSHLVRGQGRLQKMHDLYDDTHPEHAQFCATTVMAIEMLIEQVNDFRIKFM